MTNLQSWQSKLIIPLGLILITSLGIWLPLPGAIRLVAVTLLTAFIPGYLLIQAIGLHVADRLEQIVLAVGSSYGLTIVTALGILYISGHLSAPLIVGGIGLVSLVLVVIGLFRPLPPPYSVSPTLFIFIPVAVAAFFSFTGLGYSDYWGDEMNGLLRAISVIGGRSETIFEHTKGPVEILLPTVYGLLVGQFEPFFLRFPFALAYTVGVGGFFLLVQRLFNRDVALLASLILAINGLYVAFGRMVQYQAIVFLMTGLSILLAYRFYRQGEGNALGLSLFLFGVGLLAHYDMLLVLPPLGYLVWRRFSWHWPAWRKAWLQLTVAGSILLVVIAIFYIPFFMHPHATETSSYLTRRISASGLVSNNFDELYRFAVMYNSSYYSAFIILLGLGFIAVDLARLVRNNFRERRFWLTVAVATILSALAFLTGQAFLVPMLVCILLFMLLVGFSSAPVELKLIYIWIGVSFIGYVFLVDHPRTHLRIIYPGWSILAALALVELISSLSNKLSILPKRWTIAGAAAILSFLFVLFAGYEYLLFADVEREYIFTYPNNKSALYWEDDDFPYGSRRLYGAPHRLGWQMINHLYTQGDLQGDWDSNDQGSNLFWYTLGAPRNPCFPRYYFLTQFEQKDGTVDSPPDLAEGGYVPIGQVWNRDRLQIEVYEFAPISSNPDLIIWSEPPSYNSLISPDDFRSWPYEKASLTIDQIPRQLSSYPIFQPSPGALEQIAEHYRDPRISNVRDQVALVGYDLDETWNEAGGALVLTLYWQAADVINLPYKVFTHLASNSGELWAQADDFPVCGTRPTYRWQVGEIVADRHLLKLPADIPPDDYVLQVGLYEPETGLRMDLLDSMGNPQGVSYELTKVVIPRAN